MKSVILLVACRDEIQGIMEEQEAAPPSIYDIADITRDFGFLIFDILEAIVKELQITVGCQYMKMVTDLLFIKIAELMAAVFNVEIIKRETIKPSSPTPPDLKTLKLSLMDQLTPLTYPSLVLFYPLNGDNVTAIDRSQRLKTSLSETLTHFYPLAGRLKDNACIECGDDGAEYIEARINCLLSDILKKPDAEVLKHFLPLTDESTESGYQLLVQANFFECGGMAIALSISHKIADAPTLTTFIKCWSAIAVNSSEVMRPVFVGATQFPPIDFSSSKSQPVKLMLPKSVTKRFVFDAAKITVLKAKAASATVPNPTRVEVVSSLIWKCLTTVKGSIMGFTRPSVWALLVNLRNRLVPPLPDNYCGNIRGSITAWMEDGEAELQNFVCQIRKEIKDFGENYAKKLQGDGAALAICEFSKKFGELAMSKDVDFYNCTSWCKQGLYDADFGWGKPVWLSRASTIMFKNFVVLTDTRDGNGVEAWLTLTDEEMALFESNHEVLEFATVNPSINL